MISSIVRIVLPGNRLKEAMKILGPMAERTRAERGCLCCYLHQDVLEERVLSFESWWVSDTDMDRHLRSQEYRHLLLVMEMAQVPPEVRFDTVSHSTGIETIQQARA